MNTHLRHLLLLFRTLPTLALSRRRRALLADMRAFVREAPHEIHPPIPQAFARLTPDLPNTRPKPRVERSVRDLADLASLMERDSPLGYCLRRSVTRYYYLRRAGVPLDIYFGARKIGPDDVKLGIAGHAWTGLDGRPYHEEGENWQGFTVMLVFPPVDDQNE